MSPIWMFKYLLLVSIFDNSDVNLVEGSNYDMSVKSFLDMHCYQCESKKPSVNSMK
ncbi:hypothetical protein ACIQ2D_03955 [Lysinibacillus sp. NPDC097287]|uniref:hypothetical protein n=1 Tax=Lysinibacillus sp. NPDC097287 TaxID=3364144 RepID=UPI00382835B6